MLGLSLKSCTSRSKSVVISQKLQSSQVGGRTRRLVDLILLSKASLWRAFSRLERQTFLFIKLLFFYCFHGNSPTFYNSTLNGSLLSVITRLQFVTPPNSSVSVKQSLCSSTSTTFCFLLQYTHS